MASIKGKLFEFFVYHLLLSCGFQPVIPDNLLVYRGAPGLMVQGLGQPHNADVLLSPPVQTPFYYPTRLLIECKCYNKPIGLPVVRNALGLRDDINHFEVVTERILKNRRDRRTSAPQYCAMARYVYQVAVASVDGFTAAAIPFAQAHRIPLISFSTSPMFRTIRTCMDDLEQFAQEDSGFAQSACTFLDHWMRYPDSDFYDGMEAYTHAEGFDSMQAFLSEVFRLQELTTIGLLEDGTILFLIRSAKSERFAKNYRSHWDGYSIHWDAQDENTWILSNNEQMYSFELPKEIHDQWKNTAGEQRRNALQIKRDYFSQIVLFSRREPDHTPLQVIRLSEEFMRQAEADLNHSEPD